MLTHEQKEFVEQYTPMINWYISTHSACKAVDDVYGILALRLCTCAQNYDPSLGAPTTYIVRCFNGELGHYFKRQRNYKCKAMTESISLQQTLSKYSDTRDAQSTLQDTIPDVEHGFNEIELRDIIERAPLTPRRKLVVWLIIHGMRYTEVADLLGTSRQNVHATYNNAVQVLKEIISS